MRVGWQAAVVEARIRHWELALAIIGVSLGSGWCYPWPLLLFYRLFRSN